MILSLLFVALCWIPEVVESAHSRRRFVTRRDVEPRYDRSITTFSADGRLSQVEYGLEASLRGSTVTAILCPSGICLFVKGSSLGKVRSTQKRTRAK
jgi:hypothetical protein